MIGRNFSNHVLCGTDLESILSSHETLGWARKRRYAMLRMLHALKEDRRECQWHTNLMQMKPQTRVRDLSRHDTVNICRYHFYVYSSFDFPLSMPYLPHFFPLIILQSNSPFKIPLPSSDPSSTCCPHSSPANNFRPPARSIPHHSQTWPNRFQACSAPPAYAPRAQRIRQAAYAAQTHSDGSGAGRRVVRGRNMTKGLWRKF